MTMILCECEHAVIISYQGLMIEWCQDCGSISTNSNVIAEAILKRGERGGLEGVAFEKTVEGVRFRPSYHRTRETLEELGDRLPNRDLD